MNINERNKHPSLKLNKEQTQNDDYSFEMKVFFIDFGQFDFGISNFDFQNLIAAVHAEGTGMWELEVTSRSLFICKHCQALLNLTNHSVVSVDVFTSLLPDTYKDRVVGLFMNSIKKRECFNLEFPIMIFKDSAMTWIKLTANTVGLDQCSHLRIFGTITDITESKRTEDLRKDLLFMVAHDLRSPLSAIKLLVQMVKRVGMHGRNEPVVDYLAKAENLIEKVNRMIQCLLEVSEIECGRLNIFPVAFNITDLLMEAVDDMKILNASHRFILRTEPCIQVYADKNKINQVIQNLLSNAIKYSPGSDKVIIDCKKTNNSLKVSFIDFGIGINTTDQKKVFERFYRVESEQTKVIDGYGIGLYLCKQIILAHGGDIGLKSQHNQGSTFFFSLPLSRNNYKLTN